MATVTARATKAVDAPPERALEFLRDYKVARPSILTGNYTAYRVEQGGVGSGTVIAYHFEASGRGRDYRLQVAESAGSLRERDEFSTFVSVWSVVPDGAGSTDGAGSIVTLEASWQGAGGIGGIFERIFAPLGLRRIFGEILDKLAAEVAK
jgi:hypothetical protein